MKSIFVSLAIFLTLLPDYSFADNKDAARQLYEEGTRLYDVGDYQKALLAFKNAYLAYEEPALLFNMAQCYRQLGERQDAIRGYRSYLRKIPDAPNRDEVRALIAGLQKAADDESKAKANTPTPNVALAPQAMPSVAAVVAKTRSPVYRKWWLWTTVGVVAAGVAVGLGVGLTRNNFDSTLPTFSKSSGLTTQP